MRKLFLFITLTCLGIGAFASATITQKQWRWRNNNGSEASATYSVAQNQTKSEAICSGDTLRLRIAFWVQPDALNPNNPALKTVGPQLSYATTSNGTFININTSDTNDFKLTISKRVSGGTATTQQLQTGLNDAYASGFILDATQTNYLNFTTPGPQNRLVEHEWVIMKTALTKLQTYYFKFAGADKFDAELPSLTIVPKPLEKSITQTVCGSFTLNRVIYSQTGKYTQVLKSSLGCDSTINLDLTVLKPTSKIIDATACGSYTLNGTAYNESGIYTQTLENSVGCDSVITLNLTVRQPTEKTIDAVSCDSYKLNGTTYTESGTYTQVLENFAGCDSTITLNLSILNIVPSVTVTGNKISADQVDVTYTWYDCNNNYAILEGENAKDFIATKSGSYAVEIMNEACADTSECVNIILTGLTSAYANNGLQVYPSPASSAVTLEINSDNTQQAQLMLLNATGQEVQKQTVNLSAGQNIVELNVENFVRGAYLVKVVQQNKVVTEKIILK